MAGTIDMQSMRYINLLSKYSGVRTTECFMYNHQIVFCVPGRLVSKAIGRRAENVKKIGGLVGKKIKIVASPSRDIDSIKKFIGDVVSPLEFSSLELSGDELILNASRQNKAALIGRNRAREKELLEIAKRLIGVKNLKIL